MRDARSSEGTGSSDAAADWFADFAARSTEYLQRSARDVSAVASEWGERALSDEAWTVDSYTAEAIQSWDVLTPLAGEGIELWLELVQAALRGGRADG